MLKQSAFKIETIYFLCTLVSDYLPETSRCAPCKTRCCGKRNICCCVCPRISVLHLFRHVMFVSKDDAVPCPLPDWTLLQFAEVRGRSGLEPAVIHLAQQAWLYCAFCYRGHSLTNHLPLCLFCQSRDLRAHPGVLSVVASEQPKGRA